MKNSTFVQQNDEGKWILSPQDDAKCLLLGEMGRTSFMRLSWLNNVQKI